MPASRPGVRICRVVSRGAFPALLALLFALPVPADAQYFGRNKVQYDDFDFRVLATPHFDIHYYPAKREAIEDVSRMSERWYERLARIFQHEFAERKPLIFYADHPDFQQTNTVGAMIGEGTGGVAESLKNRVILPLAGSYADTDHVLGHELVHAFQYDIAQSRRGGGMQAMGQLPLWLIEGMAEYLSVGREDAHSGMWVRDAILRDDFPTLQDMTRSQRYFPYRWGQAFWTYVGSTYGDEAVIRLYRTSLRMGWEPAIDAVLGISADSISARWEEAARDHYGPLMADRTSPGEVGTLLLSPETGSGRQNVSASISPDGTRMVFMSEKDLFSFDLYLADARTGEIIQTLSSAAADPHWDALRFMDSAGAWSPDGERLAFVVFAGGANQLVIADAENGTIERRLEVAEEVGEMSGPVWSPDGQAIVFSGQAGGITDLFKIELESGETSRLTRDRHAAIHPTFSPDGRTVAFASDRGPETDFDRLRYSELRISLYDMESGEVRVLDGFGNVRHSNPQFTPDGRGLYFLSDPDGFSDIFRVELETGEIRRVTNVATAVSGITAKAPAISVARETGTVVFSVFDDFEFHVYSMDSQEVDQGTAIASTLDLDPVGRFLPPREPRVPSRVADYLGDYDTALPSTDEYADAEPAPLNTGLTLDWLGQPSLGVGQDRFGGYVGGSVAAYFSDMLGNRNLGVGLYAQGTFKDIGGQLVYQNMEHRWNWGVAAQRIPYMSVRGYQQFNPNGTYQINQEYFRIFETQALGLASYPFSTTRRVDFTGGVTRYSFDVEREVLIFSPDNRLLQRGFESGDVPFDPLNLVQGSVALVGDDSYFGFTSPVRGHRYRMEVGATAGSSAFNSLSLDYRRYLSPHRNVTVAFRGLHRGRYGSDDNLYGTIEQPSVVQPYFLGWESLVRGYSAYSFDPARECSQATGLGQCPEYDRLFGHRLAVANVEVRVPVIGTERLGLLDFSFLPTELFAFADFGLAWDGRNPPELAWDRQSSDRIPVASSGIGARVNVMGMMIIEMHYVRPWHRPNKGYHWGFQLQPGW